MKFSNYFFNLQIKAYVIRIGLVALFLLEFLNHALLNFKLQYIHSYSFTKITNYAAERRGTNSVAIRARVEHVFGFMEQSMKGLALKSVGIARATGIIGLINLIYNLFRYEQIKRLKATH